MKRARGRLASMKVPRSPRPRRHPAERALEERFALRSTDLPETPKAPREADIDREETDQ